VTAERDGSPPTEVLAERIDPAAESRMDVRGIDGVPVLECRLPGAFRALFTTRLGGDSVGRFSSLNLDPRSEDDPAAVARNRQRIAAWLDRRLVSPTQVHGLRVAGAAECAGGPAGEPCDGLTLHPEIDKGLAALLLFADCVPVVLCGEVDMAVAHGGWRGILGGIVQQAGRAMIGPPAAAVIGPSIGPCCFAVGVEVAEAFAARFGADVVMSPGRGSGEGNDLPRVDLWAATAGACVELGIRPEQVVNPRLCTACNSDFFYSYRKEGPVTGRQGCVAWVASA
jgi:copper oxidase (laccase) domain-containing protein